LSQLTNQVTTVATQAAIGESCHGFYSIAIETSSADAPPKCNRCIC